MKYDGWIVGVTFTCNVTDFGWPRGDQAILSFCDRPSQQPFFVTPCSTLPDSLLSRLWYNIADPWWLGPTFWNTLVGWAIAMFICFVVAPGFTRPGNPSRRNCFIVVICLLDFCLLWSYCSLTVTLPCCCRWPLLKPVFYVNNKDKNWQHPAFQVILTAPCHLRPAGYNIVLYRVRDASLHDLIFVTILI